MYSNYKWTSISIQRNAIQRNYEPLQIYFFTTLARQKGASSFLDIGSNIGSFALAMSGVKTINQVHAFEPVPELHSELLQNVDNNGRGGVIHCHATALTDSCGSVEFVILGKYSGANGIAQTLIHEYSTIAARLQVQARSLDSFVREQRISLAGLRAVKIDVEGHEAAVLRGATEFLRNPCLLQIEVYTDRSRRDESQYANIDAMLADFGYVRFWQIGADRYYAPAEIVPDNEELLEIIQIAHTEMINDLRQVEILGLAPDASVITRRIGPLQVSLSDPAAQFLRRLFRCNA